LRGFLGGGTFVIANSDGILDLDLSKMVAFHRDRGALATIALYQPDNPEAYSEIRIDRDWRIHQMRLMTPRPGEYQEFPPDVDANLTSAMYCGVIVAEPSVLDRIPPAPPWSLMTGLFAPMVAKRLPVFGYLHSGYFRTVDDVASYKKLKHDFVESPPTLHK
jgi:NDP-sugar pyrophosphorylase family protein